MRRVTLLSTVVVMLGACAVAGASSLFHSSYHFSITKTKPNASSGFDISAAFSDPGAPDKAPKILSALNVEFPKGVRFNVGAHPACRLTLKAINNDPLTKACPRDSVYGSGRATVIVGTSTLNFPLHNFVVQPVGFDGNKPEIDLYAVLNPRSKDPLAFAFGPTIRGSDFTTKLPDAVKDKIHVTHFVLHFPAFAANGKAVLTMPHVCPASGHWNGAVVASFADHTSQTASVTFPCGGRR